MPPKKPPFEYYDIGRPSILEDEEFAQELAYKIRRKEWEFLSDAQLDENFAEWEEAAASYYVSAPELEAAQETLGSMRLVHAMPRVDAEDLVTAGLLLSHRYRTDNPALYPGYDRRIGYPTPYESAIGLDDYVSFAVAEASTRFDSPETFELYVGAVESLSKRDGIVFPFGPSIYQKIMPREHQPMILQALALRTKDYLALLPKLIAADSAGQPGAVIPGWFKERFGNIPFTDAEIKFAGCPSFRDIEFGLVDKEFSFSKELLS